MYMADNSNKYIGMCLFGLYIEQEVINRMMSLSGSLYFPLQRKHNTLPG